MKKRLSGIFAPITTPFQNEEVSIEQLKENIHKYSKTCLSGFLVLGSNGENKSLTENEKLNILQAVLEEKGDHQLVMAGTGFESTSQTIAFSQKAAELGADFVSLLTPSYFKKRLTDEVMIKYYSDVAEAITIPVLVYNAPGFTGMTITPKTIETISSHPNIVGMKDTSSGNIGRYLEICGEMFWRVRLIRFLSDWHLAPQEVLYPLQTLSPNPVVICTKGLWTATLRQPENSIPGSTD
jgi:4-hydroxy-2-oxoglutarate aldolase